MVIATMSDRYSTRQLSASASDDERTTEVSVSETSPLIGPGTNCNTANGNQKNYHSDGSNGNIKHTGGCANGNGAFARRGNNDRSGELPSSCCSDMEEGDISDSVEVREGMPEMAEKMWMLIPAIGIGGKLLLQKVNPWSSASRSYRFSFFSRIKLGSFSGCLMDMVAFFF